MSRGDDAWMIAGYPAAERLNALPFFYGVAGKGPEVEPPRRSAARVFRRIRPVNAKQLPDLLDKLNVWL
jgi:hypothetical protein